MRQSYWKKTAPAILCSLPLLLVSFTAYSIISFGGANFAAAQINDEEIELPEDDALEEAEDAPVDAGGPEEKKEEKPSEEISYLTWAYEALGAGYSLIFLAISFTLVALFVMNLLTARRENVVPSYLIDGFDNHLNQKQYQEAYELAKADESFLGQVLSAGLAKLSTGYSQAIESMQEVGEEENMKMDHRLSYMALIGTISPMIGLFGTVHGMIRSFSVIETSVGPPDPKLLAEGISTALFTTLIGLAIAIPAIAAYNILRNRVSRLALEVGIVSEGLMSRFENVGKKQKMKQ